MVTPHRYAKENGLQYNTVMRRIQKGKFPGAKKCNTPFGHYWLVPVDAPFPPQRGRPRLAKRKPH